MPGSEAVVSFDVDAAVNEIEAALDDDEHLHVAAVFTRDAYDLAYVDETTRSMYGDDGAMRSHFDRIHEYAGIDFSEIGLFVDDLFPVAEDVEYVATGMDYLTVVRLYVGAEGLLCSLSPDADVTAVVDAVDAALDADLGSTGNSIADGA
ncbi:hypothetical protein [Halobaculum marinum]|uniref:Roadblock/LAMTOR2 domain-containing protein n=1 Tax=Halobaculum marinum TaxID=3031996 RepID=A0ABD5WYW4_9EURY|nr:hypothetical protein [Halobaculum sp. DT55]